MFYAMPVAFQDIVKSKPSLLVILGQNFYKDFSSNPKSGVHSYAEALRQSSIDEIKDIVNELLKFPKILNAPLLGMKDPTPWKPVREDIDFG